MLNEIPVQAPDGQPFRLLTLRNDAGMVVTLMDWARPYSLRVFRSAMIACAKHYSVVPARNNTRDRLHFWGPRLVATLTVSPTAAIHLLAKPLN